VGNFTPPGVCSSIRVSSYFWLVATSWLSALDYTGYSLIYNILTKLIFVFFFMLFYVLLMCGELGPMFTWFGNPWYTYSIFTCVLYSQYSITTFCFLPTPDNNDICWVELSNGLKIAVFWVVAPCSLVEVYQRFRGPCCLHHQGDE
jgi:hypothetical protein